MTSRHDYYLSHKEAYKAYDKVYREIFKDEIAEYRHNYHVAHSEHDKEVNRDWYQRNKATHKRNTNVYSQRLRDGCRMMFTDVPNADNFGRMFRRMFNDS